MKHLLSQILISLVLRPCKFVWMRQPEKVRHRIYHLLFKTDLEATRFTLAMGAIYIGMGFLWPTFLSAYVAAFNWTAGWLTWSFDLMGCAFSVTPIAYKPMTIFPTAAQLAAGTGRHTYALMAQMMPEWAWGAAFITQGCLMMHSLLFERYNSRLLWLDAFFGMVLWTVAISACYLAYWNGFANILTYKPPAIMGGEVAAALASWWVFVRYQCGGRNG